MRATPAFLSVVWLASLAAPAAAQTAPPPEAPPPAPGAEAAPAAPPPEAAAPPPEAAPVPVAPPIEAAPAVAPAQAAPPPPAAPPPGPPPLYRAPAAAPASGAHTHDGFFLRAQIGAASTTFTVQSTPGQLSSGGGALNLQIGGAINPRVILFGELFSSSAGSFTAEGAPHVAAGGDFNSGASLQGLGFGSAYCFMPVNVCLTGGLGVGSVSFTGALASGRAKKSTAGGGVLKLAVSKEWWVGNDFGLGAAVQYLTTGTMRDTEMYGPVTNPAWHAQAFGLLFSATYN